MGRADHSFVGSQRQAAGNPTGTMREWSSIGASQNSSLAGGPGATGLVITGMEANRANGQVISASVGSSAVFPGIWQGQYYHINDPFVGIYLLHGHQHGQGSNTVRTQNNQCAESVCGASAMQGQAVVFSQIATASSRCAVMDVRQNFEASSDQNQAIGDCVNPMLQSKEFHLYGTQLVAKSEGAGIGQANHMLVGSQRQAAGNPIAAMRESSSTGSFQNAKLAGSPGAIGTIVNSMAVDTTQSQTVD
jgi:hypothetical protein